MKTEVDRLIVAMIASLSHNVKLDYKSIAAFYGNGATYNSVEHRLRGYRRLAERVRAEVLHEGEGVRYTPQPPNSRFRTQRRLTKSSSNKSNKKADVEDYSSTPTPMESSTSPEPKKEVIVIEDDSDGRIKAEIKHENERVRSLLGIPKRSAEPAGAEERPRKRVVQAPSSSFSTTLPPFPFCGPTPWEHIDSQTNGYVSSNTMSQSTATVNGVESSDNVTSSPAMVNAMKPALEVIILDEA